MKICRWLGIALLAGFVLATVSVAAEAPAAATHKAPAAAADKAPAAATEKESAAATEKESASDKETDKQTKGERIQAILTETLPESEYREMTRCLLIHSYRSVKVLSDRYLLFRGSRDRVWINQLRHRCHGLRKNQILVFKPFGMSICDLDQVTASDRGFGASAHCTLGEFEKIDEQRAFALEEAIRQARGS